MEETQLKKIKSLLLVERKQLLSQLQQLTGSTDEGDELQNSAWTGYGQKSDENAAETAEYANSISLEKSLHERSEQIQRALAKIDDGSYGKCETCGNPIEEARLEAMPTATTCLTCNKKK